MSRLRSTLALLALGPLLACAGNHPPSDQETPAEIPSILSLDPEMGRAGEAYPIRLTIRGKGFAEDGNIVTFGGIPSQGLPSTGNGSHITYLIPKLAPSPGEAPPMVLDPGDYEVTVTTPAGTSEPVIFTLTRGL